MPPRSSYTTTRVRSPMPSDAIIASNAAGVGRNVGGAFASRIATGDGCAEQQHAEAGGDLIDEAQEEIRRLANDVGLKLTRILRGGFGYVRQDGSGTPRIVHRGALRGWDRLADALTAETTPYRRAE